MASIPRPLRVAVVLPYPVGAVASQRCRVEQWLGLLGPERVEVSYLPLFSWQDYRRLYVRGAQLEKGLRTVRALVRRLLDFASLPPVDVVVVHREAFPLGGPAMEAWLAQRAALVYDFDDALWLGDTSEENRWVASLKRPGKVARIVGLAAATTVGNDYLAQYARLHSQAVRVIPTTIDVERACPPGPSAVRGRRVRIGWSGSPSTVRYLSDIAPVLRRVLARDDVEMQVVGASCTSLPRLPNLGCVPWSEAEEIERVGAFDIGIMPMPDDPWTRGKCGFKALLYMSFGVATIASPVGVNREIIQDGESGLLASSGDEWHRALVRLIEDRELRSDLGAAGREVVVERYSGQRWAPEFFEVLSTAAGHRR